MSIYDFKFAEKFLRKVQMEDIVDDIKHGFVMKHLGTDDYVCASSLGKPPTIGNTQVLQDIWGAWFANYFCITAEADHHSCTKLKAKIDRRERKIRKTDDVKITRSYPLKTTPYEVGEYTMPVLLSEQPHLIARCEEEFSDSEDVEESGEPAWSRFSCKTQMEIPIFDVACATTEPTFDDIIAVGGSTIYHPELDVAVEMTIFVHKKMDGGDNTIRAEFSENPYEIAAYEEKFSKCNNNILCAYNKFTYIWLFTMKKQLMR